MRFFHELLTIGLLIGLPLLIDYTPRNIEKPTTTRSIGATDVLSIPPG